MWLACGFWTHVPPQERELAPHYSVHAQTDWSARESGATELWTIHGPSLEALRLTNGLAEEVFFRGALYSALPPRHAVAGSTAVYTLATTTTRNPALVLAASAMGSLLALQRRATGGLQAPVLTHLAWSTLMVCYLPKLFRQDRTPGATTEPGIQAELPIRSVRRP